MNYLEHAEVELAKVSGIRKNRIVLLEDAPNSILLFEFDGVRASDIDEIVANAQGALSSIKSDASTTIVIVRTGWIPTRNGKIAKSECHKKFQIMSQCQQDVKEVNLLNFNSDISDQDKDAFAYFGYQSQIMGPFELNNPSSIKIGNWVSFGRYGRILMCTDFSRFKERCIQHYPEVAHDFDPKIFGPRTPKLKIGDGTTVGDSIFINCTNSVTIGRHNIISSRVYIGDSHHNFENLGLPITLSANSLGQPVSIGDHCWLGVGSVILEGVTIGDHAIVGANSVVTKNIPAGCIAAGVPAKPIRMIDGSEIPT